MSMRLTGLISGMDTEYVVEQLMNAHRLKTTKVQNKITTAEWKQEKWASLNSKIYSFYTGALSKIRMQGSFAVKKAASSNTSKVEVSAGTNAPEGTHLIKVKQLASSQFLTGAKLGSDTKGNAITSSTKLVDLGFSAEEGTTIHIKTGDKEVNLDVRGNTTIGNLVNSLKGAGLNANFDAAHSRLFISSKTSGAENAFEITTSSSTLVREKNEIKDFLGYDSMNTADKNRVDGYLIEYLNETLVESDREVIEGKLLEIKHNQIRSKYVKDYMADEDNIARVTAEVEADLRIEHELEEGEELDPDLLKAVVNSTLAQEAEAKAFEEYETWEKGEADVDNVFKVAEDTLKPLIEDYYVAATNNKIIEQSGSLSALGIGEVTKEADGTTKISGAPTDAKLVQAADAIIVYNGAELFGSSNNFSVNGLSLTLKGVTTGLDTEDESDDEVISLSVSKNTEAVYDMIKDFVNVYNELLKEMNESYNAKSARGYDPLTDEERATMTEEQIKKWEDTIKDSLLRRDDILGGLINTFRSTLTEGVTVNGKTYSLASFGISSQNYSDRGILSINGDEDFSSSAVFENKLMEALTNNPEEVMEVLSKIGDKLYSELMDKMKSNTLSSALTVYNDKEMSKTLDNYKRDLAKLETKLLDLENRYYRQFAAMETAMAKMNSQSVALASMLGMNTQNQ